MEEFLENLPKISVITPCFNDGDTLELHIQTFLDQDYKNKELILIDDGSTDNSRSIIKKYEKEYAHLIKAIYFDKNRGACVARNEGAKIADGYYFSFLPADSFLKPGMIRGWIDNFKKYPGYDFLYGGYSFVDAEIAKPTWLGGRIIDVYQSQPFDLRDMETSNFIDGSFPLTKEIYWKASKFVGQEDGLWDRNIKSLQDWDFWLSVLRAGGKGLFVDGIFFETTMPHAKGLSYDSHLNWLARVKQIQAKHKIKSRELCVTAPFAEYHGKSVAKILDQDYKSFPPIKQHDYKAIYILGFFPQRFLDCKSVFMLPSFFPQYNLLKARGDYDGQFPLCPSNRLVHFIGSDILGLSQISIQQLVAVKEFLKTCDGVFCEIEQTQKELKNFGIDAKVVPFPPRKWFDVSDLPKKDSIAVYLPEVNADFYFRRLFLGGDKEVGLVHKMKDVDFHFFGNPNDRVHKLKNVFFYGATDKINLIIEKTKAIVRLTPHDGLPISVAEWIGAGRNALTTIKMPFANHFDISGFYKKYGKNFNIKQLEKEVESSIRNVLKKKINTEGSEYYRKWLDASKYKKTIEKYIGYNEKSYWERRAPQWNEQTKTDKVKHGLLNTEIKKIKFKSVLDIGCGNARFRELFKNKDYEGCDISENLIDICRKKYPDDSFFVSSVEDLGKHKKKYDLIFSYTVLEHVKPENIKQAVNSLKKIGKKLLLIEPTDFIPDGDYCFPHEYEKLFNVKKKKKIGDKTLYIIDL